jgi:hypothetical protein
MMFRREESTLSAGRLPLPLLGQQLIKVSRPKTWVMPWEEDISTRLVDAGWAGIVAPMTMPTTAGRADRRLHLDSNLCRYPNPSRTTMRDIITI